MEAAPLVRINETANIYIYAYIRIQIYKRERKPPIFHRYLVVLGVYHLKGIYRPRKR